MRRHAARLPLAAALLLTFGATVALAENDRLDTLLRVAAALAGAGAGLREDFEAPVTGGLTTYRAGQVLRTRAARWQVERGSIDVLDTRVRTEATAHDGAQVVELAGSPGPGVIATTVSTRVGQAYALTLHYARSNALGRTAARASVDVLGEGGSVRLHADLVHDPARLAFGAQQAYSGTFIADSARTTLRLTSLNAGNAGMTVDGISLAAATAEQVAAIGNAGAASPGTTQAGAAGAAGSNPATAAAAAAAAAREDRAAFMVRCRRETIAQFAGAARQADAICGAKWDMVEATSGIADALLATAPATGARFDVPTARKALTNVRWRARPAQGQVASGQLGTVDIGLVTAPAPGAAIGWEGGPGEQVPFELEEALKVRGATLAMIGCLDYGAAEGGRVYRVAAPGKAPFALSIYFRNAAVASQSSSYSASTEVGARLPTLASLRRDGSEWQASCPR